jgi:hypothetical protein
VPFGVESWYPLVGARIDGQTTIRPNRKREAGSRALVDRMSKAILEVVVAVPNPRCTGVCAFEGIREA